MTGKVERDSAFTAIVLVVALIFTMSMTALPQNDDPLNVVNNLSISFSDLSEQSVLLSASVYAGGLSLKSRSVAEPTALTVRAVLSAFARDS